MKHEDQENTHHMMVVLRPDQIELIADRVIEKQLEQKRFEIDYRLGYEREQKDK